MWDAYWTFKTDMDVSYWILSNTDLNAFLLIYLSLLPEIQCLLDSMDQRKKQVPQGIHILMERAPLMPPPYKQLPMRIGMPAVHHNKPYFTR